MKIGDKVEYKSGKQWKTGTIHGVKKAETAKGATVVLGYLVDTGKDFDSFDVVRDERAEEITKRVEKMVDAKLEGDERQTAYSDAVKEVEKQKDLPKSKMVTETVRQPEQVEVSPQDIRAVK